MPAEHLARPFARRMLPLAVLAGVALAVVPPVTYRVLAWRAQAAQASTYARHVAARLEEVVLRQPGLWRYNAPKVLAATVPHRWQTDIAAIEIRDCRGMPLYSSTALGIGSGAAGGPTGGARVVAAGVAAADVLVRIDPAREWRALGLVAAVSLPLGLLLALALFFFPVRVVRRQSARLAGVLEELYQAQRDLQRANLGLSARVDAAVAEQRRLSGRVIEIQEEERRRIARDLHDGIGQAIAGVQMDLELARQRPDERDARLEAGVSQLRDTLAELRRVVHELRPPELEAAQLPAVLTATTERFERQSGVATYFRVEGVSICSEGTALCLLRLLQQALTNVAQHAEAEEVAVRLSLEAPTATLEVEDDGRGFDLAQAPAGTGLAGMRERCELLGGELEVDSAAGRGTVLTMRVPLDP